MSTMNYALAVRGLLPKQPPHPQVATKPKPVLVATPTIENINKMIRAANDERVWSTLREAEVETDGMKISDAGNVDDVKNNNEKEEPTEASCIHPKHNLARGHTNRVSLDTQITQNTAAYTYPSDDESNSSCSTASPEDAKMVDNDKKFADHQWAERKNETFVNTIDKLREFLPNLNILEKGKLQAMCDMEGNSLGKPPGTASLFQLTIVPLNHTWVFDLTVLGRQVFSMMGTRGQSIRDLLESKETLTAWWDVRSDANALWFHYQVRLNPFGTIDVQLLELATRNGSRLRRHGLDKVTGVEGVGSGYMSQEQADEWTRIKLEGKAYFHNWNEDNPLEYGAFDVRPLLPLVQKYAGQDTVHLHMLYEVYSARMRYGQISIEIIREETRKAIEFACGGEFMSGPENSWAPAAFWAFDDLYDSDYY